MPIMQSRRRFLTAVALASAGGLLRGPRALVAARTSEAGATSRSPGWWRSCHDRWEKLLGEKGVVVLD
jgi:hypothetical protein